MLTSRSGESDLPMPIGWMAWLSHLERRGAFVERLGRRRTSLLAAHHQVAVALRAAAGAAGLK